MLRKVCSDCGIGKRVARENHPENCPETLPSETAEWVDYNQLRQ